MKNIARRLFNYAFEHFGRFETLAFLTACTVLFVVVFTTFILGSTIHLALLVLYK